MYLKTILVSRWWMLCKYSRQLCYRKINSNGEKEQKHPLLSRREQTRTGKGKLMEIKEKELLWDYIKHDLEAQAMSQSSAEKSTRILLESCF